jgi:hypothetical protein
MKKYKILDRDELMDFLKEHGCKNVRLKEPEDGEFVRTILFEVYEQTYSIIWFSDISTLLIGDVRSGKRLPQIPFRYVEYNKTLPVLYNDNHNIAFPFYFRGDFNDVECYAPYESFRIPIDSIK